MPGKHQHSDLMPGNSAAGVSWRSVHTGESRSFVIADESVITPLSPVSLIFKQAKTSDATAT
jgi:hypothetical protein